MYKNKMDNKIIDSSFNKKVQGKHIPDDYIKS